MTFPENLPPTAVDRRRLAVQQVRVLGERDSTKPSSEAATIDGTADYVNRYDTDRHPRGPPGRHLLCRRQPVDLVHILGRRLRIYAEAEKGRRNRLLPMTPDFAAFLLATPESERHGLVFKLDGQWTGTPMTPRRVGRVISEIGKKADVIVNKGVHKYASAHDFRRAFGTRWAKVVMPSVLQKLMRHDSIETTLRY